MTRVNERQGSRSPAARASGSACGATCASTATNCGLAACRARPELPRVGGTPLLTTPSGCRTTDSARPDHAAISAATLLRHHPVGAGVPPVRARRDAVPHLLGRHGTRWPHPIFENRCTYRFLGADLALVSGPTIGFGHYFDGIDTGEAAAHEFTAAETRARPPRNDLRAIDRQPGRPGSPPHEPRSQHPDPPPQPNTGEALFLCTGATGDGWPRRGLYQVLPVGIFQPATNNPEHRERLLTLAVLQREFAEELRGDKEDGADTGPIDYGGWPFADQLDTERRAPTIRAYCLGIGVDPLTFATDMLCVVVIDAPVFDIVFEALEQDNAEGSLVELSGDGRLGVAFGDAEISNLRKHGHTQAAGAAVLALAWQHMHLD